VNQCALECAVDGVLSDRISQTEPVIPGYETGQRNERGHGAKLSVGFSRVYRAMRRAFTRDRVALGGKLNLADIWEYLTTVDSTGGN
jgi:hypothetical protein